MEILQLLRHILEHIRRYWSRAGRLGILSRCQVVHRQVERILYHLCDALFDLRIEKELRAEGTQAVEGDFVSRQNFVNGYTDLGGRILEVEQSPERFRRIFRVFDGWGGVYLYDLGTGQHSR